MGHPNAQRQDDSEEARTAALESTMKLPINPSTQTTIRAGENQANTKARAFTRNADSLEARSCSLDSNAVDGCQSGSFS
eukprot:315663-Pleurochrysis_carterae.AAC.1